MRVRLMLTLMALVVSGCSSPYCDIGLLQVGASCVDPGAECEITCGTHEVCDVSVTPNVCQCAPGYADSPCAWSGVVQDPDFLGLENELGDKLWEDEGAKGATVEPSAPGAAEPNTGVGALAASVICAAGSLTQVLQMPSYETGEPLVAEVVYKAQGVQGVAIGFDRAWKRLPPTEGDWATTSFCLGEASYAEETIGGPVTLRVSASERLADCFDEPAGSIRVDLLDIRPLLESETCPPPGEALNPSASGGGGEWTFVLEGSAEGGLQPGKGREGTSGATLLLPGGAVGRASVTVRVSVPLPTTMPSPALVFWWKGTSQKLFSADVGTFGGIDDKGRAVETLVGSNTAVDSLYCLPPWTHGSIVDLSFSLADDGSMDESELSVDDIRVRSDAACGNAADLLDPGFESAPNRWMGSRLRSANEQVIMQSDERLARNGTGVLELTYWTSAADLAIESYVFVPEAVGEDGPAATFYSKVPLEPSTDVQWVLGKGETVRGDLATNGDWSSNEVCLPPEWSGRWFRLKVQVGPPSEAGMPIGQERVFLDDFELTTSPNCAAR